MRTPVNHTHTHALHPSRKSQSSLQLLCRLAQGVVTSGSLAPDLVGLGSGDPPGLDGRVVPQAGEFGDLGVALPDGRVLPPVGALVHGDDDGAAEAEVVLQGDVDVLDQAAVVGPPPQLPRELGALGQARRAERVTFADQPAGRVDHDLAAVGDVPAANHLVGLALVAEAQPFEDDEFVGREAVVNLADPDVARGHAGLGQGGLGRALGHVEAHEVHGPSGVQGRRVGHERLTGHQDRVGLEFGSRVEETLGHDL